jgi:hypothetical protein
MTSAGSRNEKLKRLATGSRDTRVVRPNPSEMSDTELLRAGIVAKYWCSKEHKLHLVQQEDFAPQLAKIREEWTTRFPSLPLSATFD